MKRECYILPFLFVLPHSFYPQVTCIIYLWFICIDSSHVFRFSPIKIRFGSFAKDIHHIIPQRFCKNQPSRSEEDTFFFERFTMISNYGKKPSGSYVQTKFYSHFLVSLYLKTMNQVLFLMSLLFRNICFMHGILICKINIFEFVNSFISIRYLQLLYKAMYPPLS